MENTSYTSSQSFSGNWLWHFVSYSRWHCHLILGRGPLLLSTYDLVVNLVVIATNYTKYMTQTPHCVRVPLVGKYWYL